MTTVSINIENLFSHEVQDSAPTKVVSWLLRTKALSVPPTASLSPELSINSNELLSASCLWRPEEQGTWDSRHLEPRDCEGGLPRNQEHSYPTSVAWRERDHFQKGSVCVSRIRESRDGEKRQGLPLSSGKEPGLGKGGFRERGLPSHPKHRCLDPRSPNIATQLCR